MTKYQIEVDEDLNRILETNAKNNRQSIEKFITEFLKRFTVDLHTMDSEDMKKGYEECGDINLEIANL